MRGGVVLLALLVWACGAPQEPDPSVPTRPLPAALEAKDCLQPGEVHAFTFHLSKGETARLRVRQEEVDVKLTLWSPGFEEPFHSDLPALTDVPEALCFVARKSGHHRLEITPFGLGQGCFTVHREASAPATPQDLQCQDALAALMKAETRRAAGDPIASLLPRYQEAVALARAAKEPLYEAVALKEWAFQQSSSNRLDEALRLYHEAETLAHRLDAPRLLATLFNLQGLLLLEQADWDRAEEHFEAALALAAAEHSPGSQGAALNNMGRIAELTGHAHRAVTLYAQARELWAQEKLVDEVLALDNLGRAHLMLDRFGPAEDLLREARARARSSGWWQVEASALSSLGWSRYRQGATLEATALLEEALRIRRQQGDLRGEISALDRLGSVWLRQGNPTQAVQNFRAAALQAEELDSTVNAARSRVNLGCALLELGRGTEALKELDSALTLVQESHPPDPDALAQISFCRAKEARQRGDLATAKVSIEEALAIVEDLRSAARREGAYTDAVSIWQDYAELQLAILVDAGDPLGAFEAGDHRRVQSFLAMLGESGVALRATTDPALVEQEAALSRRLDTIAASLSAQSGSRELEQEVRALSLALAATRDAQRAASPSYAALLEPPAASVKAIQRLLPEGALLLSYSLGREAGTLFSITHESLGTTPLPPRTTLDRLARKAHAGLSRSHFPRSHTQAQEAVTELASILLPALPSDIRRVFVVAEGALLYLPFTALPLGDGRVLLDQAEVVQLPSAAVFTALEDRARNRRSPPKQLVVFADALFSPDDDRLEQPPTRATGLSALPHSGREAREILALVPQSDRLGALGFEATLDKVREVRLEDFRYLHFATHAQIHEELPDLSEITLSLFDRQGTPLDGHLRLHEIYRMHLPADLVVLSACRTALGKHVRGDGLLSFTRGFLYAGASRVLVSLWEVDDAATADLMILFYQAHLRDGLTAAAALRRAQLQIRQEPHYEAPYYWAGFVLQGLP